MTAWVSAPSKVPPMMRAVTMREFGAPEVLKVEQVPTPRPEQGEVLVRVNAVSIGRLLDLVARSGKHPYATFTFPHILGAESAGVVAAVGSGVTEVAVGDRVAVFPLVFIDDDEPTRAGYPELSPTVEIIGTHRQGADAEFVVAPATNVRIVPEGLGPVEAAALAVAGTVAMNQFERVGGVGPGSRVVVQAATSALGSTTALLARHLGADVIVTSRDAGKRARLRDLGFEHTLDPLADDFADQVRSIYSGRGANVVVDNLAVERIWRSGMDALAPGGAVVTSGAFLGKDMPVDAKRLYSFGHRVIGVRAGNLPSLDRLWAEVHNGFRTVVDRTFPLENVAEAHRYMESGSNIGRVALIVE